MSFLHGAKASLGNAVRLLQQEDGPAVARGHGTPTAPPRNPAEPRCASRERSSPAVMHEEARSEGGDSLM